MNIVGPTQKSSEGDGSQVQKNDRIEKNPLGRERNELRRLRSSCGARMKNTLRNASNYSCKGRMVENPVHQLGYTR